MTKALTLTWHTMWLNTLILGIWWTGQRVVYLEPTWARPLNCRSPLELLNAESHPIFFSRYWTQSLPSSFGIHTRTSKTVLSLVVPVLKLRELMESAWHPNHWSHDENEWIDWSNLFSSLLRPENQRADGRKRNGVSRWVQKYKYTSKPILSKIFWA